MNTLRELIKEEIAKNDLLLFETSIQDLPLYSRALRLADFVHRNQIRKASGAKYINHPLAVSMILDQWGFNTWYQAIAVLHDTVEDAVNPQAVANLIKKYFGGSILKIVNLLSHSKSISYDDYLLKLAKTNKKALIVKLADTYSNLNDNPSPKQIKKYRGAIMNLIDNGIDNIPTRLLNLLKLN